MTSRWDLIHFMKLVLLTAVMVMTIVHSVMYMFLYLLFGIKVHLWQMVKNTILDCYEIGLPLLTSIHM